MSRTAGAPSPGLHRWNVSPAEARAIQAELAGRVNTTASLAWASVRLAVAVDVSMNRFAPWLAAAAVVCDLQNRVIMETSSVIRPIRFPYVPGLLSFRELPAAIDAIDCLKSTYELILCDGQGVAHPRGLGIASHLGLWLGRPSIGIAKSLLVGECQPPADEIFAESPVVHKGAEVARAIRLRRSAGPIFISAGHLCRLDDAVTLVKSQAGGRRQTWPIIAAHEAANAARRVYLQNAGEISPD
ncbi:MAG: endonuclease V [Isosphaeraceae bacterium]